MPQLYKFGSYVVYFWSNEGNPHEPVYVHIANGRATSSGTKIWISQTGRALKANNNAQIPPNVLAALMKMIEANSADIVQQWIERFGEAEYYC